MANVLEYVIAQHWAELNRESEQRELTEKEARLHALLGVATKRALEREAGLPCSHCQGQGSTPHEPTWWDRKQRKICTACAGGKR